MPIHLLPIGCQSIPLFSIDDRILLGEGLFETLRVDQRQPCYSQLHWQRMQRSALRLGIFFDFSYPQWQTHLLRCICVTQIQTGGVKVLLSGGRASRGLDARGALPCLSLQAFTYESHQDALQLVSASWLRDENNPIYQMKSVNYLESICALREALAKGADEVLFFNLDHQATETTVANLFIIKNHRILTPPLSSGVLPGVIRERLLSLVPTMGITCTEAPITASMILEADAVFVTNVLQGIRLVKSFDGHFLSMRHPLIALVQRLLAADSARLDKIDFV